MVLCFCLVYFFRMATQGNDPVISQLFPAQFFRFLGPCRTCEWSVVEHHVPCPFFHPRKGGAAIVPRSGDRRSAGKVGLVGKAVDQFQDGSTVRNPVASGAGQEEPPICDRTWCWSRFGCLRHFCSAASFGWTPIVAGWQPQQPERALIHYSFRQD